MLPTLAQAAPCTKVNLELHMLYTGFVSGQRSMPQAVFAEKVTRTGVSSKRWNLLSLLDFANINTTSTSMARLDPRPQLAGFVVFRAGVGPPNKGVRASESSKDVQPGDSSGLHARPACRSSHLSQDLKIPSHEHPITSAVQSVSDMPCSVSK